MLFKHINNRIPRKGKYNKNGVSDRTWNAGALNERFRGLCLGFTPWTPLLAPHVVDPVAMDDRGLRKSQFVPEHFGARLAVEGVVVGLAPGDVEGIGNLGVGR